MKIEIGDVFELKTSKGTTYLQYIFKDEKLGELVKVFLGPYIQEQIVSEKLIQTKESFFVFFQLSKAIKNGAVLKCAHYPVGNFSPPFYMRDKHVVKGKHLGWFIVNVSNWKREFVENLTSEQSKLSPWGIWNSKFLSDRIESNWSLSNW